MSISYTIIKNIFEEDQRKKMIEDLKPLLVDLGELHPGRQTHPTLHLHPDFQQVHNHLLNLVKEKLKLNLEIVRTWANESYGRKEHMGWHVHFYDYAWVYYLKTTPFLNSGTLFKEDGFIRSPQNSLLIFKSHDAWHTVPGYPFNIERFSLSADLNIIR